MGVPPYTLFWDRTLDELCARQPTKADDLVSVWGIGEQKSKLFGAELLAIIVGYSKTPAGQSPAEVHEPIPES
jgi:ATP-dependent DNA helicase RecQ